MEILCGSCNICIQKISSYYISSQHNYSSSKIDRSKAKENSNFQLQQIISLQLLRKQQLIAPTQKQNQLRSLIEILKDLLEYACHGTCLVIDFLELFTFLFDFLSLVVSNKQSTLCPLLTLILILSRLSKRKKLRQLNRLGGYSQSQKDIYIEGIGIQLVFNFALLTQLYWLWRTYCLRDL